MLMTYALLTRHYTADWPAESQVAPLLLCRVSYTPAEFLHSQPARIAAAFGGVTLGWEASMSIRPIKRLIKSKPTLEGAGVHLRRAFGFGNTSDFDPFLLLDDFRN